MSFMKVKNVEKKIFAEHRTHVGKYITRGNVDAHFVLSLGAKVNNNKLCMRIAFTELGGEGVNIDIQRLRVLIRPN